MATKYWESETPTTITTSKNVLSYYPNAAQLAVARSNWTDENGDERQGKTVTFNIAALLENDIVTITATRDMLAAIIERINVHIKAVAGE